MSKSDVSHEGAAHGDYLTYTLGFVLSLITTAIAFWAAMHHNSFSHGGLMAALSLLAVTQLYVQLHFFLHLGSESKPRWNLTVFAFMLLILLIVVVGSLWIMNNLNYHMLDNPQQLDQSIIQDEGVQPE